MLLVGRAQSQEGIAVYNYGFLLLVRGTMNTQSDRVIMIAHL